MFLPKHICIGLMVVCDSSMFTYASVLLLVSSGRVQTSFMKFQLSAAGQRLGNELVDGVVCHKMCMLHV